MGASLSHGWCGRLARHDRQLADRNGGSRSCGQAVCAIGQSRIRFVLRGGDWYRRVAWASTHREASNLRRE